MAEPGGTDTTIVGEDWYGADLTGAVHERVEFRDVDLSEATGRGARFADCTFRTVTLASVALVDVAFENCTFSNCSWFDARLTDCKLVGSRFVRCSLDRLRVSGGDWSFTSLAGADLHTAHFSHVRLREADLTNARCVGGHLRDCDLSGALWHGADLRRCDLRGSDLGTLVATEAAVAGAVVEGWQAVVLAQNLGLDVRAE